MTEVETVCPEVDESDLVHHDSIAVCITAALGTTLALEPVLSSVVEVLKQYFSVVLTYCNTCSMLVASDASLMSYSVIHVHNACVNC